MWPHPPLSAVTPSIVRGHTLHRSPSYPPLSAIISSIVRDDTLIFAATRWVFITWRAQIEKKYNPQGGSIPPTSLPGVASYRRQPRAIESTTPMGLMYHHPLIIMSRHKDSAHHGHLSSRHNMEYNHTIARDCAPHGHLSSRHGIGMARDNMMYRH